MRRQGGSIVVMSAISQTDSEMAVLDREQFRNEKLYQSTMSLVKVMLKEGLISEDEYHKINTIFSQKYEPIFGTLFSDFDLL